MKNKSNSNKIAGAGLLTALAASLCCITPVLALISGASGIASAFSWMEPLRPYLIGITVLVLGFAWYQKLKPKKQEDIECACEEDEKPNFWQSKKFLLIVTVFAALMTVFPYYDKVFYPKANKEVVIVNRENIQTLNLDIEGMTCESCNMHVSHAAQELPGVINATADFRTGKAEIRFDKTKILQDDVVDAVNKTGYKVLNINKK